jgi:hypothetical protein
MKVQLSFNERLNMLISNKSSFLCIGLDPVMEKIPSHLKYEKNPIMLFNRQIVEATHDLAVAYKANLAFYEAEGQNGLEALYDLKTLISKDMFLTRQKGMLTPILNNLVVMHSPFFRIWEKTVLNPLLVIHKKALLFSL